MFFFFKQKTAYEMRISDWSSDVCSSDLIRSSWMPTRSACEQDGQEGRRLGMLWCKLGLQSSGSGKCWGRCCRRYQPRSCPRGSRVPKVSCRSEEHTSELQSPMPSWYAVLCLKHNRKTEIA